MPSIMTLDGAQFGAIAVPVAPHREYHRDLIEYGHAQMLGRGSNVNAVFNTVVPGVPTHYPVRVKGTRYGQHGLLGAIGALLGTKSAFGPVSFPPPGPRVRGTSYGWLDGALGRGVDVHAPFANIRPSIYGGSGGHSPRVRGTPYGFSGFGLPTCSRKCPSTMLCTSAGVCNCYGAPCQRTGPMRSLAGAVSTGLGEITDKTKTAMVLLGALGIVGVVGYAGYKRAARRRRRRR